MDVTGPLLLKGAWYSLEQCGRLLSDATILYKSESYSSAIALAMIAREELGKYRLLLDEWKESQYTGQCPTVDAIQTACANHVDKQKRALLSLTFMPDNNSALGTAIRTQLKHKPQDKEYRDADAVIQNALKSMGKRAPDDRHAARIRALYVDLLDSGLDWNRPSQVGQDEAKKLVTDAANDYSVQRDRVNPDLLRAEGKPKLADALEAWGERPLLPDPVWPEW
jgi:AbiV family abortive infection protein